jgi:phage tail-like protein
MTGEYFEEGYPPAAFYFTVTFGNGVQVPDASFSEVSGISLEMETEAVVEGGENRFVHQLPKGIKHPNLELKAEFLCSTPVGQMVQRYPRRCLYQVNRSSNDYR